jgi:hypothetical protein
LFPMHVKATTSPQRQQQQSSSTAIAVGVDNSFWLLSSRDAVGDGVNRRKIRRHSSDPGWSPQLCSITPLLCNIFCALGGVKQSLACRSLCLSGRRCRRPLAEASGEWGQQTSNLVWVWVRVLCPCGRPWHRRRTVLLPRLRDSSPMKA